MRISTISSYICICMYVRIRNTTNFAIFLVFFFLQTWQEKEAGKVVMYTTTMGIVRETYHRCLKVKQILRTHLVKFDEKDVFMSRELQKEIRERMKTDDIAVPQVFVEGILVGVSTLAFFNRTTQPITAKCPIVIPSLNGNYTITYSKIYSYGQVPQDSEF